MENDQCNIVEQARIAQAARDRINFLAWLARALLRTDDIMIRRAASEALLQLIGDGK